MKNTPSYIIISCILPKFEHSTSLDFSIQDILIGILFHEYLTLFYKLSFVWHLFLEVSFFFFIKVFETCLTLVCLCLHLNGTARLLRSEHKFLTKMFRVHRWHNDQSNHHLVHCFCLILTKSTPINVYNCKPQARGLPPQNNR